MEKEQDPGQQGVDVEALSPAEASASDVDLKPGANADSPADIEKYISEEVRELYDVYSYRHAAAILFTSFPEELKDIERALLAFRISKRDIGMPGGNESDMPKRISQTLRPAGWVEARIQGDLLVRMQEYSEEFQDDGKVKPESVRPAPRNASNLLNCMAI